MRLAAVATVALPYRVRLMNSHSSSTMSAAPTSTTVLCGRIAAPATSHGSPPRNGGRL